MILKMQVCRDTVVNMMLYLILILLQYSCIGSTPTWFILHGVGSTSLWKYVPIRETTPFDFFSFGL